MIKVTSFYKFFPIEKSCLTSRREELLKIFQSLNMRGLILIGEEGLNGSLAGKEEDLEKGKREISRLFGKEFFWKDSYCEKWNFKRLSVKIKKEIIKLGAERPIKMRGLEDSKKSQGEGDKPQEDDKPQAENKILKITGGKMVKALGENDRLKKDEKPQAENKTHLSPEKWEAKMKANSQVLDVRNRYEWEIGQFKRAKTLDIDNFQKFPEKLKSLNMDKNKDTLIYCTGGIRCEKAAKLMEEKGFKKVYQLEGGILNYLKSFPNSQFENECFVFDHRTAVDQNLQPSKKYSLCPHCGQPGDLSIICRHCEKPAVICQRCQDQGLSLCSKNCTYHFQAGHACRKKYRPPGPQNSPE